MWKTLLIGLLLSLGVSEKALALSWKMPPVEFTTTDPAFSRVDLAADPAGNAFSVWIENGQVLASRFSVATGTYGPSEILYTGNPIDIKVATDATGTALVVWKDETTGVLLSSYFNGVSWTAILPAIASVPVFPFQAPFSLDMDGNGNGLLAWQDQSVVPFPGVVFTSFFNGTTQTWSSPVSIDPAGTGGAPLVAYSLNGTAAAIWFAPVSNVLVSNFNGTTWSALPINLSTTGSTFSPRIGIDDAGNALAVWIDNPTGNVAFSYFTGGVWSSAQFISSNGGNQGLSFAMSPTGFAVATWTDGSNVGFYSIFNGSTWSSFLPFAVDVIQQRVAINSFGDVLVVSTNTANDVLSFFKLASGSFGPQDIIYLSDGSSTTDPLAQLSDARRGFADWINFTESANIARGSYTNISPPQSISGRSCTERFATQSDRINIISWTPSLDPSVVVYYVRRNGVLVSIVPSTSRLVYFDHNRCPGRDIYTVVAVDAFGNESLPVEVILNN